MNTQDSLRTSPSLQSMDPYFMQTIGSGTPDSPTMTQFLMAVRNFMQLNHGLTFEGLLQQMKIPLQPYIEGSQFEEMCLRLSLAFSPQQLLEL